MSPYKERGSGIAGCVAQITSLNALKLSISLLPSHLFMLTCSLTPDLSTAYAKFPNAALGAIKGSIPGRKHRERTGGWFQSAGAELLTAGRVMTLSWQPASWSLRHCHPLHSLYRDKRNTCPSWGLWCQCRGCFCYKVPKFLAYFRVLLVSFRFLWNLKEAIKLQIIIL